MIVLLVLVKGFFVEIGVTVTFSDDKESDEKTFDFNPEESLKLMKVLPTLGMVEYERLRKKLK